MPRGDRLFREGTAHDIIRAAEQDPVIAERIEAFVARFSRLQDMPGDKILPLTLRMAGEHVLPMIGNLESRCLTNLERLADSRLP